MPTRILKADLRKDKSVKVVFKQQEVGKEGMDSMYNTQVDKKTDQVAHKDLQYAFARLAPHILFYTELIGPEIAIPADMEPVDFFNKFNYEDDLRFKGLEVTGIETIGKNSIDGIRIKGTKENKFGDITPIKTTTIFLDRSPDNSKRYELVVLLSAQLETLITELESYCFEAKAMPKHQEELELK